MKKITITVGFDNIKDLPKIFSELSKKAVNGYNSFEKSQKGNGIKYSCRGGLYDISENADFDCFFSKGKI